MMRKPKRKNNVLRNRYIKIFVLLFFLFLGVVILSADSKSPYENITFEHLSVGEDLSQSTVFCILQDSRGFMWFGTERGLNRYDGHTFKLYDQNFRKPRSLSYNMVISLFEDSSGILWVGTWGGGLNKFDLKTEEFSAYKNIPGEQDSLSDNNVWSIYEDESGILWVGTEKGLNKLDREKGKIIRYLDGEKINAICRDNCGTLFVGTDNGLFIYKDDNSFEEFICETDLGIQVPKKVRAIYKSQKGALWIGTEWGLYELNRKKEEITCYTKITELTKMSDKRISSICEAADGFIWIGTNNSLIRFDPRDKSFTPYINDPDAPESLSNNNIWSIYKDRDGFIWIGTDGGGINLFDPNRKKFALYRKINLYRNTDIDFTLNNNVQAIQKGEPGFVWIGTRGGGLDRFNLKTQEYTNFKIPVEVSNNTHRNEMRAVFKDHDGMLWIGTVGAGLYRFDPGEEKFSLYRHGPLSDEAYILTIVEDENHVLWIGSMNGLFRIDEDRQSCKIYKNDPDDPNSISDNKIFSILKDKSGVFWIGTGGGGINKFDGKNTFKHYLPSADTESINHNFVMAIYEAKKSKLWIGTNGGGLNKFDKEKETFEAYTTKDGLINDVICDILEDDDGCLWLSTNKGLSRFNPGKKEFRNYTVRDGLQGYEYNRGAACMCEGSLFFGGVNGFNVFDPQELKSKDRLMPPPIVITSFKKHNQENKLSAPILGVGELEISYDESISFEFAALSFAAPELNRYAYKLEPINKEWIYLGSKHVVDLINLVPGDYMFRVKGSNSDGVWNEAGISLNIKVNPPFWQTMWFIWGIVLFVGGSLLTLARSRINRIKRDNAKLKKEIDNRKQAQAEQKESEKRLRTLIETSPDAITLSDVETGKIIMANRQTSKLLEYSDEEEIKEKVKSIFDIFPPEDREKYKKNAQKTIKVGISTNTEYTVMSKKGNPIAVEMSTALIRDADGNPKYFLSITRDIRKRKEAEEKERLHREKLVQIDKMVALGTLVSGVAHELKNPLASIKMNAESFKKVWADVVPVLDSHYEKNTGFKLANLPYVSSKSDLKELITGLIESGQRIDEIIKTLRDFSQPEVPHTVQSIGINKVIDSSIDFMDKKIKKATDNFVFQPARELPLFEGNFQRLEQVFTNLIDNSCQALSDNSKRIEITTFYEKKKKRIVVEVEDEGQGITKKNLEKVTNLFFTTKRDCGGTGLGLSISSQIVKEHGGSMRIESTVGKGTIVTVYLPVAIALR
ncbi:MAG: PAS domain S-box protein [Candidatus Aminicenantes bacterium]|nr:PAS domain S-box protein [Candidatus Aminicenantes bacterium]